MFPFFIVVVQTLCKVGLSNGSPQTQPPRINFFQVSSDDSTIPRTCRFFVTSVTSLARRLTDLFQNARRRKRYSRQERFESTSIAINAYFRAFVRSTSSLKKKKKKMKEREKIKFNSRTELWRISGEEDETFPWHRRLTMSLA